MGRDRWDTGSRVPKRPCLLHAGICHCQSQSVEAWDNKKAKQCPWPGRSVGPETPSLCSCNGLAGAHGDSVHVPLNVRRHALGPPRSKGRE